MSRDIMPIMGATLLSEIPFVMLVPHEAQAKSNHGGQSLECLAQRGGLGVSEAICILEDRSWSPVNDGDRYLINKVRAWRAAERAQQETGHE
jgi:hypothetical protein